MIIGSGLLAKAFAARVDQTNSIWIYAAGVSNSGCIDRYEFARESRRLRQALQAGANANAFVYFSTCSIADPLARNSEYVQHKVEMEMLVKNHANFIVVRLPQLAGKTPNPHTLLNYLYARIARSERFRLWKNAVRNIIDVDDAALIVMELLEDPQSRRLTVNVANPVSCPVTDIVAVMEKIIGKPAIIDEVIGGSAYDIDTTRITPILTKLGLTFDRSYVARVIEKYYGRLDEQ
jgi:nucleoside-diphosphate-sugar epimerase